MKFLVDAQLPRQLVTLLEAAGHDAVHTSQLSLGNRTVDGVIAKLADREQRVVVTKDRDFWVSQILDDCPHALLIVATGNIRNTVLLTLFDEHMADIVRLLADYAVVEVGRDRLIAHADRDRGDKAD